MNKRLKVLILSDYAFTKGGAEKVAIMSGIGLADRGNEVVFFSAVGPVDPDLSRAKIKRIIELGQKDILDNPNKLNAMFSGIYNRKAMKSLRDLLSGWKPDIIHMHGLSKALSWAPVTIFHKLGLPVVYTLHDYGMICPNLGIYNFRTDKSCDLYCYGCTYRCLLSNCDKRNYSQKLWRWLRFFINRKIFRVAGRINGYIAVSRFLKEMLEENLKISAPIEVIYNPIENIESVSPERQSRPDKGYVKFLYVGRLSPEKGVDMLLEAIEDIEGRLVIVGDGELRSLCDKRSREVGNEKILVMGYKSKGEVARQMSSSSVLVLPSRCKEPAPLVLGEAAYCRLPSIVADHGGMVEFVKDGYNGLYFKAGNLDSLKSIMKKAAGNPSLLDKMGKKAFEMVKDSGFNIDSHLDKIEEFYRTAISNKK